MPRALPAALLLLAAALPAGAQDTFQTQSGSGFKFHLDSLARQEWTDETTFLDTQRTFLRLRPRVELERGFLQLGVGGDFHWGNDDNTEPPTVPLVRDNYKSDDIRWDLAFLRLVPTSWVSIQGGRFFMPLRTTEMIWDRDLRPQGASVTLSHSGGGSLQKLSATGVFARGSHVFPSDNDAPFEFRERDTIWMASLGATLSAGAQGEVIELMGAYLRFDDLENVPLNIRRQNTRGLAGILALEYDVIDLVARYRAEKGVPFQIVADYCWNTAVESDNKGLWLSLVLGSVRSSRGALEYTYAKVDKDATSAAYAGDDFIWGTGWEGHRADLGFRVGEHASMHGIAQIQKFKDSPRVEERNDWLNRWRIEARVSY
jgi:putative porin